jgi:hypothetical protein
MKVSVEIKGFSSEGEVDTLYFFEGTREEVEDYIENEFTDFLGNYNPENHPIQPFVTESLDSETRIFSIEGTKNKIKFILKS